MRYTDFVLWATQPRVIKADGKKRLTFDLLVPGVFNEPTSCELDVRALEDLKAKASSADADWNDARMLGEALAAALLPPDVWNALNNRVTQAAAAQEGIRVRLMLSGSELSNWPWEFIVFNRAGGESKVSDFLALMPNVSLVRHAATPLPAWRVEAKAPVKVMVAVASPSGWPKLKVEDERTVIVNALEGSSQLTAHSVDHARRSQLPSKMNPAHLFHFAGHGKFEAVQSPVPGANEGKASVILEDEYGDEDPLDAEALAVQLRDAGVRVAVLGACQTAQRDDVGAWSSVAEALLKAELGAVVGMQFPVRDGSALSFAQRFYASLAVGLSIDEAVSAGRVAVAVSEDPRGWATPVLYLRSPDGVIFSEFASDPALESAREEASIKAYQKIKTLKGKAITARIGHVEAGTSVEVTQIIESVEKDAEATTLVIDTVGSRVERRQENTSFVAAPAAAATREPALETPISSSSIFGAYMTSRTHNFTGREWVFQKIQSWMGVPGSARNFLLTGGPGTGKTAVAARFAQMSLGEIDAAQCPALGKNSLAYFHFCQAGLESTLSPLTFVQSLSEALANRYPAFRVALERTGSRQIVVNQTVGSVHDGAQVTGAQVRIEIKGGDARPLFDQAVRLPLLDVCKQLPNESIVILVDSLDEALTFNAENNITQLLKLVGDFPPQARFFFTCRTNSERVFDLIGRPALDLIADAPPGLDEVRQYAAARLNAVPEPMRSAAAERIAEKSKGNFLYAYHVLNDFIQGGAGSGDVNALDLPDELEDVYRKFIEREMASNTTRWNDVYRPLLGPIAVARGDGLTKPQLIGITNLAEDTATDVLSTCAQYLVGGESRPYRIYHQSFRDFLMWDKKYTVYPAERHAAIAQYLQDRYGSNWGTCNDEYALRHTPLHWADSATLSDVKREPRTQTLIALTSNGKYQRRFESRIGELPMLHSYLQRAVEVAALNERDDMLPWLIKAAKEFGGFRRNYLRAESVVALAEEGKLEQAERRLPLFSDLDEDWQAAARLIIAWLGIEQNRSAAEQLRDDAARNLRPLEPLPLLRDRLNAALISQPAFPFENGNALSLEVGQELVKRVSGQAFNRELLGSVNPSFITKLGFQSEMMNQVGYAANFDGPILVRIARQHGTDGTELVDQYVQAHAGYNYVEYRNRSLWMVLHAVLRHHPDQDWVKQRLRLLLVTALSGGGVDFTEMAPLTAAVLSEQAIAAGPSNALDKWRTTALAGAQALQSRRGANDSWGNHKRRLTALMELYQLLLGNGNEAKTLLNHIFSLPDGFAGFQAPANLRLADAIRACRMETPGLIDNTLQAALRSAHHIQDYHFCARITARCNALVRWHRLTLSGADLAGAIRRLAQSPGESEFAADHLVHEPYLYRDNDGDSLPIDKARQAETIEQLMEVFQRPAVEFRRLNPQYGLTEKLGSQPLIRVPDPGFAPLLAVHLAARALADDSVEAERTTLIRSLAPVAVNNPTALDTVLSYLLIAAKPGDPKLLEDIVREIGPVVFSDVAAPAAQIGPDATMPA